MQILLILRECWSGKAEEVQWSAEAVVGHLAESGRDVRVAGGSQGVDREAAEGGHVVRAVSGADCGGVLGEGGVADEVETVLDGPLRAGDLRDALGGGLAAGQIGDDVDGLAAAFAGGALGAVPDDLRDLDRVGEVDAEVGDGQGADDAGLQAAVCGGAVVDFALAFCQGRAASWRCRFFWLRFTVKA